MTTTGTDVAGGMDEPWVGEWIAPEPPPPSSPMPGFGPSERAGFSRSLFRRTFELTECPSSAPTRVSADSRYVLSVNGVEVGRGPARSQPLRQRYDCYDIAAFLRPGPNALCLLVSYYGTPTSFWMPAPRGGALGNDAVLVYETRLGRAELIASDGQWRARRSPAWTLAAPLSGLEGVPVELFDARQLDPGWREAGFDDSAWPRATVLAASHVGGGGRTRPPTYPYGRLRPRRISQLAGERVEAGRAVACAAAGPVAWESEHPAARVLQVLAAEQAVGDAAAVPAGEAALPLSFDVGPASMQHVAFDFGRVVAGFVELELDAPPGSVVEMYYRERPYRRGGLTFSDPTTGARFVARGGRDRLEAVELNGLRFAHLVVHAEQPARVTIFSLAVREHLYPRTGTGYFSSSDAALDALYRAGIRTVQLNSFDSYTDCPTREQRAWVGDAVVHQMVDLASNADWGLARNYIEICDSPRSDGALPMSVVGDIEASGGLTIPDWALSWVHGVYNMYWYEGPSDALFAHLPTIERVLRWFADYADRNGTIADVPEWNLVDWASIFLAGRSSILTALWARGLRELAEMSEAAGDGRAARWARARYAQAAAGFEDFWDAERGLYVDHILDGRRKPASSQAANATAIVSGLAPQHRWPGIVERITDGSRLVVRSWIGGEDGGYDAQRFAEQMAGIYRIDWDAEREIVLAEPYFSYVVHDAVALSGRAELLLELVRRWQQFLVDGYDTFGECWGWGTPVHGWSATPARDLVCYVLGISPAEPGFTRARVAPRLGPLERAAGAAPTPHGLIEVNVDGASAEISSPVPVLLIRADRSEIELGSGNHQAIVR
jgi:alpha-L-rhamnosidase